MAEGVDVVRVTWTRAELEAVREAIEVTPNFTGRIDTKQIVRSAVRSACRSGVDLPTHAARKLAENIVPKDHVTALARVKLARAVRDAAAVAESSA